MAVDRIFRENPKPNPKFQVFHFSSQFRVVFLDTRITRPELPELPRANRVSEAAGSKVLGLLDGVLLGRGFRGPNGAPGVNLGIRPKPQVFRVPETANPRI